MPDAGAQTPRASVVIPNWNGAELLAACLKALGKERLPLRGPRRLSSRNQERLYLKHMPGRLFWARLPARLLYNLGRFAVYLAQGRGGAFLRGKAEALAGAGRTLPERRRVQAGRRATAGEIAARIDPAWFHRHFLDSLRQRTGSQR